jgi:hypothetical protein
VQNRKRATHMPLKGKAWLLFTATMTLWLASFSAWGYTVTCEAQGSFPEMEKISIKPATVEVNIKSIGIIFYLFIIKRSKNNKRIFSGGMGIRNGHIKLQS